MLTYISNTDHYKQVLSRVQSVKHMLWIGTADIKDLFVEFGKEKKPFHIEMEQTPDLPHPYNQDR